MGPVLLAVVAAALLAVTLVALGMEIVEHILSTLSGT